MSTTSVRNAPPLSLTLAKCSINIVLYNFLDWTKKYLEILEGKLTVMHPGKGGCADPVNEDAILERVGGRPPGRNRERQLASDTGGCKT